MIAPWQRAAAVVVPRHRWAAQGQPKVMLVDYHGTEMLPDHRIPTHPGRVLREEFLVPFGIALAAHLRISLQRINEIVRGKRGVTPHTAWLLAGAFGTTPEFWVALQVQHDLARARPRSAIRKIARSA